MTYHCANCQAERWEEVRHIGLNDTVELKIIYECDSYVEFRRVGASWKRIGAIYKCKIAKANGKLIA